MARSPIQTTDDLAWRHVLVEGYARPFRVPQYINRINYGAGGGWQVRFTLPSTFFADRKHGTTRKALNEAIEHLNRLFRSTKKRRITA